MVETVDVKKAEDARCHLAHMLWSPSLQQGEKIRFTGNAVNDPGVLVVEDAGVRTGRFKLAWENTSNALLLRDMSVPLDSDERNWTPGLQNIIQRRFDASILAFYDPDRLLIPIMPTKGMWANVRIEIDKSEFSARHETMQREIWLGIPLGNNSHQYCGILEYPFSMMDLRNLVINTFDDTYTNKDFYCTECSSDMHQDDFPEVLPLDHEMHRRWSFAHEGICEKCESMDVSEAVPSFL